MKFKSKKDLDDHIQKLKDDYEKSLDCSEHSIDEMFVGSNFEIVDKSSNLMTTLFTLHLQPSKNFMNIMNTKSKLLDENTSYNDFKYSLRTIRNNHGVNYVEINTDFIGDDISDIHIDISVKRLDDIKTLTNIIYTMWKSTLTIDDDHINEVDKAIKRYENKIKNLTKYLSEINEVINDYNK